MNRKGNIKIGPSAQRLRQQSVGLCLFTSPTSHLARKSDLRAHCAAPCRDKISTTRHRWLFVHSLAAGPRGASCDCQVQKCENASEHVCEQV